jgi:hypothetical protein
VKAKNVNSQKVYSKSCDSRPVNRNIIKRKFESSRIAQKGFNRASYIEYLAYNQFTKK